MSMSSSSGLPQTSSSSVKLAIDNHSRWFFTGRTGMGKSHLMKHLAKMYVAKGGKVAIVDGPDHSWIGREADGTWGEPATSGKGTVDKPRLVRQFDKKLTVQLFRPTVPGHTDERLFHFLEALFKEENRLVIFDELFGILDMNHQPEIVMQVWSQGRKHNIAAWAASQRPARIPEIIMSQADSFAIFNILNTRDRQKLAEWTNSPQILEETLPPHYWWYFGPEMQTAKLMKPIGGK